MFLSRRMKDWHKIPEKEKSEKEQAVSKICILLHAKMVQKNTNKYAFICYVNSDKASLITHNILPILLY